MSIVFYGTPCIVSDPVISENELNHDLKVINQRAYQWKMECNPDPNRQARGLLFSCKENSSNHPSLYFKGTAVSTVDEQRHL